MTDPANGGGDSAVAHPIEAAADLTAEVRRGRSWRTPFLALGGVTLAVAGIVLVVVVVVFIAYYVA